MSKIAEFYNTVKQNFANDPALERNIQTYLGTLVTQIYYQSMNSTSGYCHKFTLPLSQVLKITKMLDISIDDMEKAYRADWGYPSAQTKMYSDAYYHILLLLIYYGLKEKKEILTQHALFLILVKLWNGRKTEFIQFCDEKIMAYVTTHMVNKKHLVHKYDSPLNLLTNYFVPTLLDKYGPETEKNIDKLKNLFMQSWSRIRQVFSQNIKINSESGAKEAAGGLAYLYYKAYKEGLSVSNPLIKDKSGEGEDGPTFDQYATTHIRDEIAQTTTDYITLNSNPSYDISFVTLVNKATKVSTKVLEQIFKAFHNHKYYDHIHDIIVILLSKTNIKEKAEICDVNFMIEVKQKVISSKNNEDARKIQKLLDLILMDIFSNKLGLTFEKYSDVQRIQIRTALIHCLVHNLRRNICHGQIPMSQINKIVA